MELKNEKEIIAKLLAQSYNLTIGKDDELECFGIKIKILLEKYNTEFYSRLTGKYKN